MVDFCQAIERFYGLNNFGICTNHSNRIIMGNDIIKELLR